MSLANWRDRAPVLKGLPDASYAYLASVAEEASWSQGQVMFEADSPADRFYLVDEGKVGLEVTIPGRPPVVLETLGPGDLVGVSWLFPPFEWAWRARALTSTTVIAFDAERVRRQCEVDTDLALHLYRTVAREAVRRLHGARIRLLDIYPGTGS
jgi:CRP-like cAMP-binding protein